MTKIFISHSHSDVEIADYLVDFLKEAMRLGEKDIRCTSDPSQGLSFSTSSISDQLKADLKEAGALIVLATLDSHQSPWILSEVGSFWTTEKIIAPIVGPGLTLDALSGPLKGYLTIEIEKEKIDEALNALVNQLADKLDIRQNGVTRQRTRKLNEFINKFRAWQSKRDSQEGNQQKIAELTEIGASHPGQPSSTKVSGNRMIGKKQKINIREPGAQVEGNLMKGEEQEINVDNPNKPKNSENWE